MQEEGNFMIITRAYWTNTFVLRLKIPSILTSCIAALFFHLQPAFMEGTLWYQSASQWFRRDALCILHPKGDKKYLELFRNFITDPQRAGRFVASGDVYATITIDLIIQLIAEYEQFV